MKGQALWYGMTCLCCSVLQARGWIRCWALGRMGWCVCVCVGGGGVDRGVRASSRANCQSTLLTWVLHDSKSSQERIRSKALNRIIITARPCATLAALAEREKLR